LVVRRSIAGPLPCPEISVTGRPASHCESWPTGIGDAAPHRRAVVIILRRKLIGARGAFVEGLLAIAQEHQVVAARQMSISSSRIKVIADQGAVQSKDG
jgi:hypothetical protein